VRARRISQITEQHVYRRSTRPGIPQGEIDFHGIAGLMAGNLLYWGGLILGKFNIMGQLLTTPFDCPNCGTKYRLVRVKMADGSAISDGQITCRRCGGPFHGREGPFLSDITRDRIMKAAERRFAERGYDGTSIRAIVAKARVNRRFFTHLLCGGLNITGHLCGQTRRPSTIISSARMVCMRSSARGFRSGRRAQPSHPHFQLGNGASHGGFS
jgi:Bacterial regulatory proteins, tetR family